MKNQIALLIMCSILFGLIVVGCQKDDISAPVTDANYPIIDYCEDGCGSKSGSAPFLNLSLLYEDSTQNLSNRNVQNLYNGHLVDSITGKPSGGLGANYLNLNYNHYHDVTIKWKDGTKKVLGTRYVTHVGPLAIKGPLPTWSGVVATQGKVTRYLRSEYKPAYLPLRAESWRVYMYLIYVDGVMKGRDYLYPKVKESRVYRVY